LDQSDSFFNRVSRWFNRTDDYDYNYDDDEDDWSKEEEEEIFTILISIAAGIIIPSILGFIAWRLCG